jgi:hypothetical protein
MAAAPLIGSVSANMLCYASGGKLPVVAAAKKMALFNVTTNNTCNTH